MTEKPAAVAPKALVVMGVSGSGKTTIAALLGQRLGWQFQDADWFHPRANVEKMHSGVPLTDEDRWPWLAAIAQWLDGCIASDKPGIVGCSALKRAYRDVLVGDRRRGEVGLVFLNGSKELIGRRLAARHDHFMPASLLDSQFATLEPPGPDEAPIEVSIDAMPSEIVDAIVEQLTRRKA
jgi:carbohydrate kinase (thermoresistant glucokinase family)